jgi:hypothetical protein
LRFHPAQHFAGKREIRLRPFRILVEVQRGDPCDGASASRMLRGMTVR